MPAIDAVFRKQIATAPGGNAYAQKHVIERYDWAELERQQGISYEFEINSYHVETQRTAIADAQAKKQPPPAHLPHPDDVVLDPERGVRFVGPFTEEGRALIEENARVRDALIMQDALDWRLAGKTDGINSLDQSGGALVLAHILNDALPERYRLSENLMIIRPSRYTAWSKRRLLKEVHRGWRSLGIRAHSGATIGSTRYAKQAMDKMIKYLTEEAHEMVSRFTALPLHIQIDSMGFARSAGFGPRSK